MGSYYVIAMLNVTASNCAMGGKSLWSCAQNVAPM